MRLFVSLNILIAFLSLQWPLGTPGLLHAAMVLDLTSVAPTPTQKRDAIRAEAMRDPFSWPYTAEKKRAVSPLKGHPLVLQAILWNKDCPLALIDGKVVGPGDILDGAVVLSIKKDLVVVRRISGKIERLQFKPEFEEVFAR